jgi:hypothetical protein
VVRIQSEIKRGFLRQIYNNVASTAIYFEDALLAFQSQIFTPNFQRGRIIVSTSGGGQQGSFLVPSIGVQFTQDQVFAMAEEFCQIYTDTVAALQAETPGFNPKAEDDTSENQVFVAMLLDDRLQGVYREYGDFSMIRS